MLVNRFRVLLLLLIATAFCPILALAADITEYVPENALGFAVVRNMAATSAKLESLAGKFQAPLPPPLAFFKLQTGFGKALKEDGDLLVALLPPRDEFGSPGPMALVPVMDYAAFVKTFDGDPSGEVCPVTVSGEDVLVAKRGEYAVFMNPEYRDEMQRIVSAQPKPLESVTAMGDWLGTVNGGLVLLPAGAKMLLVMAHQELSSGRSAVEQQFEELEMDEELATLQAAFEVYGKLLGFVGDEVTSAALGVRIEDSGNVLLGIRGVARQDGHLAELGAIRRGQAPLAGVPEGPYVIAGGAPWPAELSEAMLKFSIDFMKSMPAIYGLQGAPEEDLQKLEASLHKAFAGLKHVSFVVRPGEGDEPIYSNMFMMLNVESAGEYIENYKESIKLWNEISSTQETKPAFKYEFSEDTVAGQPGLAIVMDFAAMMGDAALGPGQQAMEVMFGEGGKMRAYVALVDDDTVLVGYSAKQGVEQMVDRLRNGEASLASGAAELSAARLLPDEAPFVAVISPQGCVNWFRRMINAMVQVFGAGGPPIPDYPETPPIGIAIGLQGRVVETDVVFPAEMIDGLSMYIKQNR
jgi:hypothetical protein